METSSDRLVRLGLLSLLLVCVTLAGGVWLYRSQENKIRLACERDLLSIADLKTKQIADWRRERLGDARILSSRSLLAQEVARWLVAPDDKIVEEILDDFRAYQQTYHYYDVILLDATGTVRLTLSGRQAPIPGDACEIVSECLKTKEAFLTDLHVDGFCETPHLSVIAPLWNHHDPNSAAFGAIILVIDAEYFLYPMIQTWPVTSDSAESLLVRREGDSVLFLNELRHQQDTALKLKIPLTQKDVPSVMAVEGRVGFVEGIDYRGVEVFSALKRIPDSPWFLVAKVDKAEALVSWQSESRLILSLILAGLLICLVFMWTFWLSGRKAHFEALYKAEVLQKQAENGWHESEERFSLFLHHIPSFVFIKDADGRTIHVSDSFSAFFGLSIEQIVGKTREELFPPEVAPRIRADDEGVLATGIPKEIYEEFNGRHYQTTKFRLERKSKPPLLAGFAVDITERRNAEEALKRSESRFRGLFESIGSGVAVYKAVDDGEDFEFVDFNPAGQDIEQTKREDALGRRVTEVFPGVKDFGLLDVLRRVWRTGVAEDFPAKIYKDDHVTGWRENFVYRLDTGEVVAVYDDVTVREQALEALQVSERVSERLLTCLRSQYMKRIQ